MEEHMLTTIDNPFNPFTQFDEWFAFDEQKGYHSCAYLARVANTSLELSDADYALEVEQAIDDIIKYDPLQIYRKVCRSDYKHKRLAVATT